MVVAMKGRLLIVPCMLFVAALASTTSAAPSQQLDPIFFADCGSCTRYGYAWKTGECVSSCEDKDKACAETPELCGTVPVPPARYSKPKDFDTCKSCTGAGLGFTWKSDEEECSDDDCDIADDSCFTDDIDCPAESEPSDDD